MPYSPAASVAGVALRVTRLDAEGNLLNGPTDSYLTTAFIRVSFTPEYEEGDEITEKAADGTVCVSFKAPDTLKRVNMEIAVCDPDPELSALMSGGLILSGPNQGGTGDVALGWASAQVGEDPSGNGVAVETWSKAIDNGKEVGFFHWVFPYVKTRLSGDRVIENGLLATTFEGFGLGNIMFRNGPDGAWAWPAATDRPYLYARSKDAPSGLRGFFQYGTGAGSVIGSADAPAAPVATPPSFTNIVGTNVPGSGDPYPYDPAQVEDNVLSVSDYTPDESGAAPFPASADVQTVRNDPDEGGKLGSRVDNPVTYLDRGAPGSGAAQTQATATTLGQQQAAARLNLSTQSDYKAPAAMADLATLKADGTNGDGHFARTFGPGTYIVLADASHAYYDGGEWFAGEMPTKNAIEPDDVFGTNRAITASDAGNAAKLSALGYAPASQTAWGTGEKFTIGGFDFNWDGNDWAAGAHA